MSGGLVCQSWGKPRPFRRNAGARYGHGMTPPPAKYADETEGQLAFYEAFQPYLPQMAEVFVAHTDGVVWGNLLEFKLAINDTPAVLFQAVKYLAKLRLTGRNVPRRILLVDLNARRIRVYDAFDYRDAIHQTYASAASRSNDGFRVVRDPDREAQRSTCSQTRVSYAGRLGSLGSSRLTEGQIGANSNEFSTS